MEKDAVLDLKLMLTSVCSQMDLNNMSPNSEKWELGSTDTKNIFKYRGVLYCAYGFLFYDNRSATDTFQEVTCTNNKGLIFYEAN